MEFSENSTNLYVKFVDGDKTHIDSYNPSVDQLLMECQLSGSIQAYDFVGFELYTKDNHSLCDYGSFVACKIPVSKFIMTGNFVYIGVQAKGRNSMFAHMTHWLEDNSSESVYMNFSNLFSRIDAPVQLKMMVSGIKGDQNDVLMRDLDVLTITK